MKLAYAAFVLAAGCGSPSNPNNGTPDAPPVAVDALDNTGWTTLAQRNWSLAVGEHDKYECTRVKIDQDMYITGFRAMGPVGTHHSVVTVSNTATPLGDYDCTVGALDFQMLYAAGVNTDDLAFPTNVAMKISAGQYVNLNLHLFNASDNPLTGPSGILVKTITAAQASGYMMADMTFSGTMNISVPSDNTPHTASGGCKAPTDWHIFNLWPHMHQTAIHQSFSVNGANLLDMDYAFSEQRNYPMAVTTIHQGDTLLTTCTYKNNTGATVQYGESSTNEMCFTGLYKYPAGGNLLQCALN